MDTQRDWEGLAGLLKKGQPLVLLVGAGVSAKAGVSTGLEFRKRLEKTLTKEQAQSLKAARAHPDDQYAMVLRAALPSPEERRAAFEGACWAARPQPEHRWIARLMAERRVRAVVTTNFDHLIEHALLQIGAPPTPVLLAEDEFHPRLLPPKTPPLVKLHGDLLFDDIANLPEELQRKLNASMKTALLALTKGADLLAVGYSGSDRTVVDLVAELLRTGVRVWWSQHQALDTPSPESAFGKAVRVGEDADNPVAWLGPWGAEECLRQLGCALGVAKPVAAPFGVTGEPFAVVSHFVTRQQCLPGSAHAREAACRAHQAMQRWIEEGRQILVLQEAGAGTSTLLGGLVERVPEGRGLYFDLRFADRPEHLDLSAHVAALGRHLGVATGDLEQMARALFRAGAVIAIDGLTRRHSRCDGMLEASFLATIHCLCSAHAAEQRGALIVATHYRQWRDRGSELWGAVWPGGWPGGQVSGLVYHMRSATRVVQPAVRDGMLEVLWVAASGVPEDVAKRAAGITDGEKWDWQVMEPWVERRGGRVALRERAQGQPSLAPEDSRTVARNLAMALEEFAARQLPLRRVGPTLAAEALYRDDVEDPGSTMRAFLSVGASGLGHEATRDYFVATLLDLLRDGDQRAAGGSPESAWGDLVGAERETAADLVGVALWLALTRRPWTQAEWAGVATAAAATMKGTCELLAHGSSPLQQSLIEAHHMRLIGTLMPANNQVELQLALAERIERELRTVGRADDASLCARAACALGETFYESAESLAALRQPNERCFLKGLAWSRRARAWALEEGLSATAGRALDNVVTGFLALERAAEQGVVKVKRAREGELVSLVEARRLELAVKDGFSEYKAVSFANIFQLEGRLAMRSPAGTERDAHLSRAEAAFFEAALQCAVLQRHGGVHANLGALKCLANDAPAGMFPEPTLIERTRQASQR